MAQVMQRKAVRRLGRVPSLALLADSGWEHNVAFSIQQVGVVLAPPRRSERVLESQQIDGFEAVHRIASVCLNAPAKDADQPLPPGPGPRDDAGCQPPTTATQATEGQWQLESDPGFANRLWGLARRAADDANLGHWGPPALYRGGAGITDERWS